MTKEQYKTFRRYQRAHANRRARLIHLLINYRSYSLVMPPGMYPEKFRMMMVCIKKGLKNWDGDALRYFEFLTGTSSNVPCDYRPYYGNRYRPPSEREKQESEIPF